MGVVERSKNVNDADFFIVDGIQFVKATAKPMYKSLLQWLRNTPSHYLVTATFSSNDNREVQ